MQLLPCREEPAPPACGGPEAIRTPRRAAERLLAAIQRVEAGADAALAEGAGDMARRLALLEVSVALGTLRRAKSEVAARLLVLAHAGRARRAYAQAHGGMK